MRVRLALAAVAVAAAVAASVAALELGPPTGRWDTDEASAGATPETGVLSARRVPDLLATWAADARVGRALDAAVSPAGGETCLSVEIGERRVYDLRSDVALVPASTMKLITAMAALTRLGPNHRWTTTVARSAPIEAGVVDGPLYLVGGGDPLLATSDYANWLPNAPQPRTSLEALADRVVAAGVAEVRGGVVGDESRYDSVRHVPTWKPGYLADNDVGPVSALNVNDGLVRYRPEPVRASDPAANAARLFAELLAQRGVAVDGPASSGIAPADATAVASIQSLPASEVVAQMMRESDNLTAELLVKELGARERNDGSWPAGLEVVRDTIAATSVPVAALQAVDGSGLDVSDRLSCSLLMEALDATGPDGPVAAGMAVAGRSGTLAPRFRGGPAEGRLRAKTGSLNYVAGLVGYVEPPVEDGDGEAELAPIEFALIANSLPDRLASGRALQHRVGNTLAGYHEAAPAVEALRPLGYRGPRL